MEHGHSKHLTDAGIAGVGTIPFGVHLCSFYLGRQDLVDMLVPFFKAGLQNRERCIWITAPPLPAGEAVAEMRKALPDVDRFIADGTLRVLDAASWYQGVSGTGVLRHWLDAEEKALADGYQGLRLSGNTSFVERKDWAAFMQYENTVNAEFVKRRIIALCCYDLGKSSPCEVLEVTRRHQHTLARSSEQWEIADR